MYFNYDTTFDLLAKFFAKFFKYKKLQEGGKIVKCLK